MNTEHWTWTPADMPQLAAWADALDMHKLAAAIPMDQRDQRRELINAIVSTADGCGWFPTPGTGAQGQLTALERAVTTCQTHGYPVGLTLLPIGDDGSIRWVLTPGPRWQKG